MLYELKNIKREFKGKFALDIPELKIKEGKIYTLIGPNGAGKTTLLHLLSFLDEPGEGELYFQNERVSYSKKTLLEMRRRVVLLDQYPILFTGPVWKNVEFGLKVRGVGTEERKNRVREVLDLVGMESFINADAHKLSGGETKRVALARALAPRPDVLLCDEPGANVDKENQEIILSILAKINRMERTSVIFSTHYLSQGRRLADHTLMLEHGMLSSMVNENIYRAFVTQKENGRVQCQTPGNVLFSIPDNLLPDDSGDFKLHIDPERIMISDSDIIWEEQQNILKGHVEQINQDRGRVRIGLELGIKLSFFLSMQEYLKQKPVIGGKLTVSIPDNAFRCNAM